MLFQQIINNCKLYITDILSIFIKNALFFAYKTPDVITPHLIDHCGKSHPKKNFFNPTANKNTHVARSRQKTERKVQRKFLPEKKHMRLHLQHPGQGERLD
jgi:hypothetical protein